MSEQDEKNDHAVLAVSGDDPFTLRNAERLTMPVATDAPYDELNALLSTMTSDKLASGEWVVIGLASGVMQECQRLLKLYGIVDPKDITIVVIQRDCGAKKNVKHPVVAATGRDVSGPEHGCDSGHSTT